MKRYLPFVFGTVLGVLLAVVFSVRPASASTGCFTDTNGHLFETFICWLYDHGISVGYGDGTFGPEDNVTRGQMAVFLQRLADIPPTTGQILVSVGYGDWMPFTSSDPLTFIYATNNTIATRSATGTNYLSVHPDVPTVLYGRSLQLLGVEFCYQASADAALDHVELNTFTHSTGIVNADTRFSDNTVRTDEACRYYTIPTPVTLGAEMGVNFFIRVNWTVAPAEFSIGRTTFVLQATDFTAAPPSAPETMLTPGESLEGPTTRNP